MSEKIKILWWSDFWGANTGFAVVARNLIARLYETGKYEFKFLAINYSKIEDADKYGRVIVAENSARDYIGRKKLLKMIMDEEFDILFTFQDHFNMCGIEIARELSIDLGIFVSLLRKQGKIFKWISYMPVDGNIRDDWFFHLSECDKVLLNNEYGKNKVLEINPKLADTIDILKYGVDTNVFYPIEKREEVLNYRRNKLKVNDDEFLVVRVDRNHPRKDYVRTIDLFSRFHKVVPKSKLYCHCGVEDIGYNLANVTKYFGLKKGDVTFAFKRWTTGTSVPEEELNLVYNSADIVISTTLGEGCGLSSLGAMASKRCVLFPKHTSFFEIIGENEERGKFIECLDMNKFYYSLPFDNEVIRPVCDIEDGLQKLLLLYNDKELRNQLAERGYQWVKREMSWDNSVKKLDSIFTSFGKCGRNRIKYNDITDDFPQDYILYVGRNFNGTDLDFVNSKLRQHNLPIVFVFLQVGETVNTCEIEKIRKDSFLIIIDLFLNYRFFNYTKGAKIVAGEIEYLYDLKISSYGNKFDFIPFVNERDINIYGKDKVISVLLENFDKGVLSEEVASLLEDKIKFNNKEENNEEIRRVEGIG